MHVVRAKNQAKIRDILLALGTHAFCTTTRPQSGRGRGNACVSGTAAYRPGIHEDVGILTRSLPVISRRLLAHAGSGGRKALAPGGVQQALLEPPRIPRERNGRGRLIFFSNSPAVAGCPDLCAKRRCARDQCRQDDPAGSRSPSVRPDPLKAEFGVGNRSRPEIQCSRQNRRTDSPGCTRKIGNDLGFQAQLKADPARYRPVLHFDVYVRNKDFSGWLTVTPNIPLDTIDDHHSLQALFSDVLNRACACIVCDSPGSTR